MRAIAEPAGLVYYALSMEAVRQGVRANSLPEQFAGMIRPQGVSLRGVSSRPKFHNREYRNLSVRFADPRSARHNRVTLLFTVQSHGVPGPAKREKILQEPINALGMSIDEFVVHEAPNRCRKIRSLDPVSEFSRIYRYEDVIYAKKSWIEDMARYLQIDVGDDAIDESIAKSVDIVP